jgi:hypothetical protein
MLATRLEDPRRLADPRFCAEPKLDGQRAQLHVRDYLPTAPYTAAPLEPQAQQSGRCRVQAEKPSAT